MSLIVWGREEKTVKGNGCGRGGKESEGMTAKTRPWGKGVSGKMHFIFLHQKITDILFQLLCHLKGERERER